MPGMDGLEVCRRIRQTRQVPVIMLTARGDEADRVVGLELGADDYVPKPFSPRELLARLRAVLRRVAAGGDRRRDRRRPRRDRRRRAARARGRRAGRADRARVRHPAGAGAAAGAGRPARDAAGGGGAQRRHGQRPHRRRARLAPAQEAGRRSEGAAPHQDGARRRLRAGAGARRAPGAGAGGRTACELAPPPPATDHRHRGRDCDSRLDAPVSTSHLSAASGAPFPWDRVLGEARERRPGWRRPHPPRAAPALRRAPAPPAVPLVRRGDLPQRRRRRCSRRTSGAPGWRRTRWRAVFLFGIPALLLWTAAGRIARRISRPIYELTRAAQEMGQGNLAARASLGDATASTRSACCRRRSTTWRCGWNAS